VSQRAKSCVEIEPDLVAAAMGEAEPAQSRRVSDHVGDCPPCRREFEQYRTIDHEVGRLASEGSEAQAVARSRERLEARLFDLRSRLVAYEIFPSAFGDILIARSEQGVLLVEYLRGHGRMALKESRLTGAPGIEAVLVPGEVERFHRELRDYLEGRTHRLTWPLDFRLARSAFHRKVLEATAAIPYGAVMSYRGLACEIGRPEAVRATAQALRWNPLPIVVPCHRVIGSSGALTGYAGGKTTRKQRLLTLEGVPTVRKRDDFEVQRDAMYVLAPGEHEYCLPTCPTVDPFPRGGVLFSVRGRAEAQGLQPCGACRPDLHPLTPAQH
jgi:methylated-DNA-[protein]-cysteine S-methyltransferase